MMGDPNWFCLFKSDFSDKNNIKGNLRVKISISDIQDIHLDKMDAKRINIQASVN